jgi:hypothetical protein
MRFYGLGRGSLRYSLIPGFIRRSRQIGWLTALKGFSSPRGMWWDFREDFGGKVTHVMMVTRTAKDDDTPAPPQELVVTILKLTRGD